MKKFVSTLVTVFSAVSLLLPLPAESAEEPQYEYTIINNEATITGYKGEPVYIDIPETIEGCQVVELRDNAFYECSTLRHIDLPDTLIKIGHHCFYACSALEEINVPESVTDIGMGCFCGCTELSSASLPDTLTSLPESCFRSCTSLGDFTVPAGVTRIGAFCFSSCTSLKNVSLSSSLKGVGDCSFYMCSSLKGVYVPPSVSDIGLCAFGYVPTDNGAETARDFVLLGDGGSPVRDYARENHITFTDASDTVHAFAIQRITGERRPINIPSVLIIAGAALLIAAFIFVKRKNSISSKAKINKNR
ncbi:Leucine rich repeat-containing protein [Ruminococcus sp. YRD2003]|uniref:leucine-rich repeat domain-containing protein n=1 Tax=Ruminococcus sp. YRD2003 TaxID=1452313 RepID=UPI0008B14F26|nr:Leucine rich repeat-containing protein [Ruminococcus flavefaciens]